MTVARLIHTKVINSKYGCESKENINLEKLLVIYNINKCFEIIAKLNIVFIISNKKNCYLI